MSLFNYIFDRLFPISSQIKEDVTVVDNSPRTIVREVTPKIILEYGTPPQKPIYGYKSRCSQCKTVFLWNREHIYKRWSTLSVLAVDCPICEQCKTFELYALESDTSIMYIPTDYEI